MKKQPGFATWLLSFQMAIFYRGYAHNFFEFLGEKAGAFKAASGCDLIDGDGFCFQQLGSIVDADARQVLKYGAPCEILKQRTQVVGVQVDMVGDLLQIDGLRKMLGKIRKNGFDGFVTLVFGVYIARLETVKHGHKYADDGTEDRLFSARVECPTIYNVIQRTCHSVVIWVVCVQNVGQLQGAVCQRLDHFLLKEMRLGKRNQLKRKYKGIVIAAFLQRCDGM